MTMVRAFQGDDLAVWPNGVVAVLEDVWDGHYHWMSDDYERVRMDDVERLAELGVGADGERPG